MELVLSKGRHAGSYVLLRDTYKDGNRLAVMLKCNDDFPEPYATISVNIPHCSFIGEGEFAYDMNNLGQDMLDDLVEQGIVSLTGLITLSGFCEYPIVKLLE